MENQSDERDEIAPAQLLQAANTTAATAQQARFLMRCRRSYSLSEDAALLLEDLIVCKAGLVGTASGVREYNRGDCCMLLPQARLSKSQFGVLGYEQAWSICNFQYWMLQTDFGLHGGQ
jgi:hypothetical protein